MGSGGSGASGGAGGQAAHSPGGTGYGSGGVGAQGNAGEMSGGAGGAGMAGFGGGGMAGVANSGWGGGNMGGNTVAPSYGSGGNYTASGVYKNANTGTSTYAQKHDAQMAQEAAAGLPSASQGGWGTTMNNAYSGGNLGALGTAGVQSGGAGGSGMMGYGGGGMAGVANSGWGGPGGSAGRAGSSGMGVGGVSGPSVSAAPRTFSSTIPTQTSALTYRPSTTPFVGGFPDVRAPDVMTPSQGLRPGYTTQGGGPFGMNPGTLNYSGGAPGRFGDQGLYGGHSSLPSSRGGRGPPGPLGR